MSKFLFLLCPIILIITVSSVLGGESGWDSSINLLEKKDELMKFLNHQKEIIHNSTKGSLQKISQTQQEFYEKAEQLSKTLNGKIFSLISKMNLQMQKQKSNNIFVKNNILECYNMKLNYTDNAFRTLKNVRSCLLNTITRNTPNLEKFEKDDEILQKDLTSLVEATENCTKNLTNQTPTSEEIQCIRELASKSVRFQILRIQSFLLDLKSIEKKNVISDLTSQLTTCTNVAEDQEKQFEITVHDIENCIMIDCI